MAAIHDALAALHGDEKYADLTVTCGDHIFKLHRAVICPQSPFFEKACSGGFMEASTGHINLSEEDPEILKKFIRFIYTGNYDDEDHLSPEGCDEAVLQPVDEILFSLRHGTDLPDPTLYYPEGLWIETGGHRNSEPWLQDIKVCGGCKACLCSFCDPDETGLCAYDNQWNYRFSGRLCTDPDAETYPEAEPDDYSSDKDEDDEDDGMDGDFPLADLKSGHNQLLYPSDDGYITALPHAMFTSVRVYVMADMFCVPALKLLARNRFYRAVEMYADSADFPDVVDEVFETTAPDDWVLKEICVLFIRARCLGIEGDKDLMVALQPVICRHEDIVHRMQLLPEPEARCFEEGRVYKHEIEDEQQGVAGDEGSPGLVSLPDRARLTDQEED